MLDHDLDVVILEEVVAGKDRPVGHAHFFQGFVQVLLSIIIGVYNSMIEV